MIKDDVISCKIKDFFNQKRIKEQIIGLKVFVTFTEGILLYQSEEGDFQHIGALMAGLWQAAMAINPENKNVELPRLSFDTGDSGFYLLSLDFGKNDQIISIQYQNQINPGKVKMRFRLLRDSLENYLKKNINQQDQQEYIVSKSENFLFNDISDSEMDSLFSFGGR